MANRKLSEPNTPDFAVVAVEARTDKPVLFSTSSSQHSEVKVIKPPADKNAIGVVAI